MSAYTELFRHPSEAKPLARRRIPQIRAVLAASKPADVVSIERHRRATRALARTTGRAS